MLRIVNNGLSVILISAVLFFLISAQLNQKNSYLQTKNSNKVIVVELFTSQGCSSCPSADRQMANLSNLSKQKNLTIYPLAFHVDYWDYLGWKDVFSKEEFSDRQRSYARVFRKQSVYTPQMVINGKYEFVGSNEQACNDYIAKVISSNTEDMVNLRSTYSQHNDSIEVSYVLDKPISGVINIAVVQNSKLVNIRGGENAGLKMQYYNIVRDFIQVDCRMDKSGTVKTKLPSDIEKNNYSIFVYSQNKINMRIQAATRAVML